MIVAAPAALVKALEEAATKKSGTLYVSDRTGNRSGRVYFTDGKIYAVQVDGFMPKIGRRLHTGNMLTDSEYEGLLSETNHDAHDPRLGDLAVAQGYIDQATLDVLLRESLLSSIGAMFSWENPTTRFKSESATVPLSIPPVLVSAIVKAVTKRRARWDELWAEIAPGLSPEQAYPKVSPLFDRANEPLSSEVAALLDAADGSLTLDEVAGGCGLTRFETGHVLAHLVANGIVGIDEVPDTGSGASSQPNSTAESTLHDTEATTSTTPPDATDVSEAEYTEYEESDTFGPPGEMLPDGMDLGTIPTEAIEADLDSDVIYPLPVVAPSEGFFQDGDPHRAVPVSPSTAPLSLPVFDGPVLPCGVPEAPVTQTPSAGDVEQDSYPLPPLPEFVPDETPVATTEVADPVATQESLKADDEPTDTSADDEPTDTSADDEPTDTSADDEADPTDNPRTQRLVSDIALARESVEVAEGAFAQMTAGHQSHANAITEARRNFETYQTLSDAAQAERAALEEQIEALRDDLTDAIDARESIEAKTIAFAEIVTLAEDRFTATQANLARAQRELDDAHVAVAEAQKALTAAQEQETDFALATGATQDALTSITEHEESLVEDLAAAIQREQSYLKYANSTRALINTLEEAHTNTAALIEGAEERVRLAHENLKGKESRLNTAP